MGKAGEASEKMANEAAKLAHEAIFGLIDKADDLEYDSQKIGAFLCAVTYLYKNALQHALRMGQPEAVLVVNMFQMVIAEDIAALAERAAEADIDNA